MFNGTFDEAKKKIEWLNTRSPDQIRDYFLINGVRGMLQNPCQCPVSNYLRDYVDEFTVVSVSPNAISLFRGIESEVIDIVGSNLSNFIMAFDRDEYPMLEDHWGDLD